MGVLPCIRYQVVFDDTTFVVLVLEPSVSEEVLERLGICITVPYHSEVRHRAFAVVEVA